MNKKICLSLNSTLECFCCNSSKIRNLLVLVDIRFFLHFFRATIEREEREAKIDKSVCFTFRK